MRYQHLLVPVGFSEPVSVAIETALELAAQNQAKTTLLHVIEAIDLKSDEPDDGIEEFYTYAEAEVRLRMAKLIHRFVQAGLAVEQQIVVGRRVQTIVQYSATESIDLIVMQSHRADPTQPHRVMTSLSNQVSLLCQCPVMLIK